MSHMRARWSRIGTVATVLAAATWVVACSGQAPIPAPTGGVTASPSRPGLMPGPVPDPSVAVRVPPAQRGDCVVDPADPGLVTFVVISDDDTHAVEVTYPVFRTDGTRQVRRMTQPGPVIVVVQSPCTDEASAGAWPFAASGETRALSCALFVGGVLIARDSASAEGSAEARVRATCPAGPDGGTGGS